MVTFAPEANVCTLSSVPEGFESDIAVIHALYFSANNKTMTPEDAVTVSQLDHNNGLISKQRRQGLLQSMQTLCKDVDIEEIVSIKVSKEEFQRDYSNYVYLSGQSQCRISHTNGNIA